MSANNQPRTKGGRFAPKPVGDTPATILQSDTQTPAPRRTRGLKLADAKLTGEALPAYDQHLADLGTIRTLEAQKADLSRTIERMESERVFQNERIAGLEGQLKDAAALAASRQETLKGRNKELQEAEGTIEECRNRIEQLRNQLTVTEGGAKADQLAFRAAMWGAIETLTAGSCALQSDDPKWTNTPPADLAGLLVEAVDYGRIGIEMTAVVEELLGIEGDPSRWKTQIEQVLAERNGWEETAVERQSRVESLALERDRLQVERDQWKATAERYQLSTNNLGGLVKVQARGGVSATVSEDAYPGDALAQDLPAGLLRGLRWPTWLELGMWAGAVLAWWVGYRMGGAK